MGTDTKKAITVITKEGMKNLKYDENIKGQIDSVRVSNGPRTKFDVNTLRGVTSLNDKVSDSFHVDVNESEDNSKLYATAKVEDWVDASWTAAEPYKIYEVGYFIGDILFAISILTNEAGDQQFEIASKKRGEDLYLSLDIDLKFDETNTNAASQELIITDDLVKDNFLIGDKVHKISNQSEFDKHFYDDAGEKTIEQGTTIVLSTGQYQLKNPVILESNVSIIGFNPEETIIEKKANGQKIFIGASTGYVASGDVTTGVYLEGWTFDGINVTDASEEDGGAFFIGKAKHCTLNCHIINHSTAKNGGAIYCIDGESSCIKAHNIRNCSATTASSEVVANARQSELSIYGDNKPESVTDGNIILYTNVQGVQTTLCEKLEINDLTVEDLTVTDLNCTTLSVDELNATSLNFDNNSQLIETFSMNCTVPHAIPQYSADEWVLIALNKPQDIYLEISGNDYSVMSNSSSGPYEIDFLAIKKGLAERSGPPYWT